MRVYLPSSRREPIPHLISTTLQQATHHAREGCRLDPASGEAWSTLAFVLHRSGDPREAIAAARKAVSIDPDDWRHYLRLAFVSWGEERLRAAHRVLTLCPRPRARALVCRDACSSPARCLMPHSTSCARGARRRTHSARRAAGSMPSVCTCFMDWYSPRKATRMVRSRSSSREMAFEADGQLYARECSANTWYAHGAIRLRQGRRDEALRHFARR